MVEFYTWKCKKCGKDINRDEFVALVKVADGKEVSRVVGNYNGAGGVYESPNEIMGKDDTAAWHELCGHATINPEFTPSKPGVGDGRGVALPKFQDKTAMLEQSLELVKELFAAKTTVPRKRAIIETIAKFADVSITAPKSANENKEKTPEEVRAAAIAKVSRLKGIYNTAKSNAEKDPSEDNKKAEQTALDKYESHVKETAEKYPDWAKKREESERDD